MESLLKQLSHFGPVLIRFEGFWKCACEVKAFNAATEKQVAKTTGTDLYKTLRELLKLSTITHKNLIDKARAPKQGKFDYGLNSDYREVI